MSEIGAATTGQPLTLRLASAGSRRRPTQQRRPSHPFGWVQRRREPGRAALSVSLKQLRHAPFVTDNDNLTGPGIACATRWLP
eukprot:3927522-Alexandrium_andersonii.AAC.1